VGWLGAIKYSVGGRDLPHRAPRRQQARAAAAHERLARAEEVLLRADDAAHTLPGRTTRSQPMASRALKQWRFIM
jgi:hypothetical protein